MRKGHAPKNIQARLAAEDLTVDQSVINEVFTEYGNSKEAQLASLLEKKAASFKSDWNEIDSDQQYKVKMKLARSLVAKGFSPSEGLTAIESYFSEI